MNGMVPFLFELVRVKIVFQNDMVLVGEPSHIERMCKNGRYPMIVG
jgi:hypothetical protein